MTASMIALTSAAVMFVALLLVVAWLLWHGRDVPVWARSHSSASSCLCCRSYACWRWPS